MKLSFYRYLWLVCLTLIWSDGAAAGGAAEREFLVGGDISALAVIEEHGGIFRDPNQPGDAIAIMRRYGANCFRLRLFVQPTGKNVVVNDLAYTIALARRIRAAGGQWLLDFHYSDTWADPAHQTKPAAWEDLPFEQPEARVYEYTRDCLGAFQKAGVPPDLVQPGNEITPGMLWPDGKLHDVVEPERQWERFTRLLRAAVRGIQAAPADRPPRIVIHIDQGANWPKTRWFFERIEKYQVPCDVIGL
ncbi:MAG: glycosyl hydrolase 53 family protein, partial [Sedimentisphaerales bacterium]|nr:glycosyl hydrolase 53 family protein [Sedimentisphaerales bacterium]